MTANANLHFKRVLLLRGRKTMRLGTIWPGRLRLTTGGLHGVQSLIVLHSPSGGASQPIADSGAAG
eukprot:3572705-Amphidinium_carterae.1